MQILVEAVAKANKILALDKLNPEPSEGGELDITPDQARALRMQAMADFTRMIDKIKKNGDDKKFYDEDWQALEDAWGRILFLYNQLGIVYNLKDHGGSDPVENNVARVDKFVLSRNNDAYYANTAPETQFARDLDLEFKRLLYRVDLDDPAMPTYLRELYIKFERFYDGYTSSGLQNTKYIGLMHKRFNQKIQPLLERYNIKVRGN